MSKIMQAWEQVLREAVSSEYDEREFALFQIGLVLQRHNPHVTPDSDVYEESLSRELLRLRLDEKRQRDTVTYLVTLARQKPKQAATLLFALSNAQPNVLVQPLLALLHDVGAQFDGNGAYQALLALEGVLKYEPETFQQAAQKQDITGRLEAWAEADDELLADKADLLLGKIEKLRDS